MASRGSWEMALVVSWRTWPGGEIAAQCSPESPLCRYYQEGETQTFKGVENEWPIFFIFMIIDGVFKNLPEQVNLCV